MARNRSWNAALPILVIALLLPLGSCKKSDEVTPVDVILSIDVYNHTQGLIYDDYKITAQSGSTVSLTKAMFGVSGVKSEYLILRKMHSGDTPGEWVAESNTGTLSATVPNMDTGYDLFLLNDSDTAYDLFWLSGDTRRLNWNFFRQDWDQTGPDQPLNDGIAFLDACLDRRNQTGMRYGSITIVATGNQANGDVRYGYQNLASGWHNIPDGWWSVNAEDNYNDISKYLTAVSEGGELLTNSNNMWNKNYYGGGIGAAGWETWVTDAMCLKFLMDSSWF